MNARILLLTVPLCLIASAVALLKAAPDWVSRSNQNAQILLSILAKYSPETASELGVPGMDDRISRPSLDEPERRRHDLAQAISELQSRVSAESDPLVKQDLAILIDAARKDIRSSTAYEQHTIPYTNAALAVFGGVHGLLDDQIAPARRPAAVVRLKKYAGLEPGYRPLTVIDKEIFRAKAKNGALLGPPRAQVEQDLATMDSYVSGIGDLFRKYQLTGYDDAYAQLKSQMAAYRTFVQTEVLPRTRSDFRLPPDLYAVRLDNAGVDYTPAELERLAHQSFAEIQAQMSEVAAGVARANGFPSSDYRAVIRALKKNQLSAADVMPRYHETLAQIENAIRAHHLVTLPDRPCIVRVASAAETSQQPAPHYQPPQLIGNNGQQGQFVLPGGTVGPDGKPLKYDDFTFRSATWTLTAHEARPGHDLQFSSMVERGVSQARAIFAFNSTNVEGWGLYAEWFMLPYMPADGQLISLQLRLLRAARAFLDPELQEGKVTRDQALKVLEDDVVISEAFATEEVDRFTFRAPGQAVSYFDGYTRLRQLRADVEKQMGANFNEQQFHDFILSQGMLPPALLRKAVLEKFVGRSKQG
ncbi:MAG: DUF885 domain-containing protein [Acidobacteriaceae bacterium]|nr:DUF885 domain-containing protein [Acidobacteriaceae bacterium]